MHEVTMQLSQCFQQLMKRQLQNLLWHVQQKTPIHCGGIYWILNGEP